jgi:hypothetical protein
VHWVLARLARRLHQIGLAGEGWWVPHWDPESLEIGKEVFFEIVGHGFQHRAAARQIMPLAGGPVMLA